MVLTADLKIVGLTRRLIEIQVWSFIYLKCFILKSTHAHRVLMTKAFFSSQPLGDVGYGILWYGKGGAQWWKSEAKHLVLYLDVIFLWDVCSYKQITQFVWCTNCCTVLGCFLFCPFHVCLYIPRDTGFIFLIIRLRLRSFVKTKKLRLALYPASSSTTHNVSLLGSGLLSEQTVFLSIDESTVYPLISVKSKLLIWNYKQTLQLQRTYEED